MEVSEGIGWCWLVVGSIRDDNGRLLGAPRYKHVMADCCGPKWPIGGPKVTPFAILAPNTPLIVYRDTVEAIKVTIEHVYAIQKSILRKSLFVVVVVMKCHACA
jgi:hypothetical protein